jgi:hypothetical protein
MRPPPKPTIPAFPAELNARLRVTLKERLGRDGTEEELEAYHQGMWAIATLLSRTVDGMSEKKTDTPLRNDLPPGTIMIPVEWE